MKKPPERGIMILPATGFVSLSNLQACAVKKAAYCQLQMLRQIAWESDDFMDRIRFSRASQIVNLADEEYRLELVADEHDRLRAEGVKVPSGRPVLLKILTTEAFEDLLGFWSQPGTLFRRLNAHPLIPRLIHALAFGSIREKDVREYVKASLLDFQPGISHSHDVAFAALAVAFGEIQTPFAREYFETLGGIPVIEVSQAKGVAFLVLEKRQQEFHHT
jgi:hypothetical protein